MPEAGISLRIDSNGTLQTTINRIATLSQASDRQEMFDMIGALLESQTRRRFEEGVDPSGTLWKPWSEEYAESKHGPPGHAPHPGKTTGAPGHDILVLSGDLRDSIQWNSYVGEVEIGSNLNYAAKQQKKREFLGVGPEDADEIEREVVMFIEALV